jgi:hypothetical protein
MYDYFASPTNAHLVLEPTTKYNFSRSTANQRVVRTTELSIAAIYNELQGAEELKEMKQSIHDFIKHHRINKQLAKRMQNSFEHEWKNTKGIDMNSILKTFPECIQADICLHLNRDLLNNCSVFADAGESNRTNGKFLEILSVYFL